LVAILFLLFDLEAAFLLPVALSWNELVQVGPIILGLIGFFMAFFVLGLWYEFKVKALEWER
jgi:NADH-quinone oxidoreductase subunit A